MYPKPFNEPARLFALDALEIEEGQSDPLFERVIAIAQTLFDAPTALISLIEEERQWFKARCGLDATEATRAVSFCAHTIMGDEVVVVLDATMDLRFRDNPYVVEPPHLRFYAGTPLVTSAGFRIGTICVIDTEARPAPEPGRIEGLRALGCLLIDQLEARRRLAESDPSGLDFGRDSGASDRAKREFLALMSHELRTPLNAILGFGELLASQVPEPRPGEYATEICTSAGHLLGLIDRVLAFSFAERGELSLKEEVVGLGALTRDATAAMTGLAQLADCGLSLELAEPVPNLMGDGVQIRQILLNLIGNAIQSGATAVTVTIAPPSEHSIAISVTDNGPGMSTERSVEVMGPFAVGENIFTRRGEGLGLGLPLTSRLLELHGGALQLLPAPGGTGLRATAVFPSWRIRSAEPALAG